MALVGWIFSVVALLSGLALMQDMPFMAADMIGRGLLCAAFLLCPGLWTDAPFGITAKPRIAACIAMVLALPAVLMPG